MLGQEGRGGGGVEGGEGVERFGVWNAVSVAEIWEKEFKEREWRRI